MSKNTVKISKIVTMIDTAVMDVAEQLQNKYEQEYGDIDPMQAIHLDSAILEIAYIFGAMISQNAEHKIKVIKDTDSYASRIRY